MPDYFIQFPRLVYANTECLDISRRVGMSDEMKNNITAFYPYEITDGMRSDLVAHAYYGDAFIDWLIYLSNGIVDPYYGWYLGQHDFEDFITKKYGSMENASRRIKHYRLNWEDDDLSISPSHYNNVIPEALRKYFMPVYGVETQIIAYNRRREQWITNTNRIVSLTISGNNTFQAGELCSVRHNLVQIGSGEIQAATGNTVIIQHVSGDVTANNVLVGESSNGHANITNSIILQNNLTEDEYVYWTPVSYLEWEIDKNERNKFVNLIDPGFTLSVSEEMRLALKDVNPANVEGL